MVSAAVVGWLGAAALARPLVPADLDALRAVSAPAVAPDGRSAVYDVTWTDADDDVLRSDLVRVDLDTGVAEPLTRRDEDEYDASYAPDGRTIAFLSSRDDPRDVDQVWLLPAGGGEARRLTDWAGGIEAFSWAPDGKHLAVIAADPDPVALAKVADPDAPPAPIVLERLWFKEDGRGYLSELRRHLALVDVAEGRVTPLTSGPSDDASPVFSPDGKRIAFVSKRPTTGGPDPDATFDFDVYVVDAVPGAVPVEVTADNPGPDCDPEWESPPRWSPDGRLLAITRATKPELLYYARYGVALVPAAGGAAIPLGPTDRNTFAPRFSADGREVLYLLEDDGTQRLVASRVDGRGALRYLTPPELAVDAFDVGGVGKRARIVARADRGTHPSELAVVDSGGARFVTDENAWLAGVDLVASKPFTAATPDGSEVHGFVLVPPGDGPHPTFVRLHGGPVSQYDGGFLVEAQVWAGAGYAVILPNPRGSSGRGEAFSTAIVADWGNLDTVDVLAAVDEAVRVGIADPDRLVVGGWSYGGILTDQVIARDGRFVAAVSGAGIADVFAGWGTDMYVREYIAELGTPWEHPDVWMRNSFPFLHADRIHTPTLFQVGTDDFNVPAHGSEQMYQALRVLGVPTALVLYPGEEHGLERPSFLRDRLERRLAWAARFVEAR